MKMKRLCKFLLFAALCVFIITMVGFAISNPALDASNSVLVIIDVQNISIPGYPQAFFPAVPGQNTSEKISNIKSLIQMANRTGMKTLVTFEGSDQGVTSMPEELKKELPASNIQKYIKTFFDITKKPEISQYFESVKAKNIIVCGAETDVCVTQSVIGLLEKGYKVFLAKDATYTSTTLNAPALQLMEKSGAKLIGAGELIGAIENGGKLPKEHNVKIYKSIPDLEAANEAIVVVNFDDESLPNVTDAKKDAKIKRIQYLTHYADMMSLPLYFIYDGSMENTKKMLFIPPQTQFIKVDKLTRTLQNIAKELKGKKISQIVLGGIDEASKVYTTAMKLDAWHFTVFLMEDAFFYYEKTDETQLEKLYKKDIIPFSLKMFLYDSTESSSLKDMPADWERKFLEKFKNGSISYIEELPLVKDSQ